MQALWGNAIWLSAAIIQNNIKHPQEHKILLQVMTLALLPAHKIRPTFEEIKKEAKKSCPGHSFDDFFIYFEDYWLDKRGVDSFCVHGQHVRSANPIESYHRGMNKMFKNVRPTVWRFLGTLLLVVMSKPSNLFSNQSILGA